MSRFRLFVAVFVGVGLVVPSGAGAARWVAPANDAVVRRQATVLVAIAPDSRLLSAHVNATSVRARFHRSGRTLRARLPRRLLHAGVNLLHLRVRERGRTVVMQRVLIGARDRERLLSLTRRGGRVRVRTRSRLRKLELYVNGNRVRGALSPPTLGGLRTAELSPDEGIHHGRNRIFVRGWTREGALDSERLIVFVSRTRPLAAAGRDRIAHGRRVRLHATHRRRGYRYHWTLVRKPRGSRARILDATGPNAILRKDRRGRYRVRLRVTRLPGLRAHAAAATADTDTTTIHAPGDDPTGTDRIPPVGLAVDTMGTDPATGRPAIVLTNPTDEKPHAYPVAGGGLTGLVLDRTTGEVEAYYPAFRSAWTCGSRHSTPTTS